LSHAGSQDGLSITPQQSPSAQQWLFEHNINAVSDEILSGMYNGRIQSASEELIVRLGIEIPFRDIRVQEAVLHLCEPSNHQLLPDVSLSSGEMRAISKLYFGFADEIGRCLELSNYGYEESYLSGLCFFGRRSYVDRRATDAIIAVLGGLLPQY
jgi:hypothetical protein